MIRDRQAGVEKVARHDLLSALLETNDHDLDQASLTEGELISMFFLNVHLSTIRLTNALGNIYMFLVAGHEVRTVQLLVSEID